MIAQLRAGHVFALPATHVLEASAFLAITIAATWPLMAASSAPALALAIWIPGIVAIVLTRLGGHGVTHRLGLDRLGWADAYFGAIWIPVLFAVAGIALTAQFGAGRVDADLGGILPADGSGPVDAAVSEVIAALTLAPLANMLTMVGGEIGWRGFLLPLLLPLGKWRAIGASAALWALWQLPIAIGAAEGEIVLSVAVQIAWSALVGAILAWLFVRTRSPWASALFMGTIGATSIFWPMFLRDAAPVLAGQVSIIGLIAPALVLLVLPWIPEGEEPTTEE